MEFCVLYGNMMLFILSDCNEAMPLINTNSLWLDHQEVLSFYTKRRTSAQNTKLPGQLCKISNSTATWVAPYIFSRLVKLSHAHKYGMLASITQLQTYSSSLVTHYVFLATLLVEPMNTDSLRSLDTGQSWKLKISQPEIPP